MPKHMSQNKDIRICRTNAVRKYRQLQRRNVTPIRRFAISCAKLCLATCKLPRHTTMFTRLYHHKTVKDHKARANKAKGNKRNRRTRRRISRMYWVQCKNRQPHLITWASAFVNVTTVSVLYYHVAVKSTSPSGPVEVRGNIRVARIRSLRVGRDCGGLVKATGIVFPGKSMYHSAVVKGIALRNGSISEVAARIVRSNIVVRGHDTRHLISRAAFGIKRHVGVGLNCGNILGGVFSKCVAKCGSSDALRVRYRGVTCGLGLGRTPRFRAPTGKAAIGRILRNGCGVLGSANFEVRSSAGQFRVRVNGMGIASGFAMTSVLSR